ncbi:uncharacterized protein CEXT_163071 [Caerostris extrusa]|uniref:Uncharacterized protein n=1 Tax=Caerostris extrusa TaxID=172846 RepID=A0AAV4YA18_CAEEX|nr:uncharacterized protein CEXT_163071 [Caerostris extrusa]
MKNLRLVTIKMKGNISGITNQVPEIFPNFEDLKRRTDTQIHSNPKSSSSLSYNCMLNNTEENRQQSQANTSSVPEHGNISMPGSPSISKFKYKGTKGFGRPARTGYKREDEKLKISLILMKMEPRT